MKRRNTLAFPAISLSCTLCLCLTTSMLGGGAIASTPYARTQPAHPSPRPQAAGAADATSGDRKTVADLEFLGQVTIPTGRQFQNTEIGGLSGIAYDAAQGVYYSLSDDRSERGPARFYALTIDLRDGRLEDGDIAFSGVTPLRTPDGQTFPALGIDPEGIALTSQGTVFISSEGDSRLTNLTDPFVREFGLDGRQRTDLPVPEKFKPQYAMPAGEMTQIRGVRNNLAFESLTITPNGRFLYTATENALIQDGPAASLDDESLSRILKYDLTTGQPVQEFVYVTDLVAQEPIPPGSFSNNGLVELIALDNYGTFLALERAFSTGRGNTIRLYEGLSQGALDVSSQEDLFREEPLEDDGDIIPPAPFEIDPPVQKILRLDFSQLGVPLDNVEGMTFGPALPDGRQTLIVVSDNNFSATQVTQFFAFAVQLKTIPVALPTLETPTFVNNDEAPLPEGARLGDADDPAIWVHPTDSSQSLVLATLKDGGLVVFDLNGHVLQEMAPEAYGDVRYNNVDLVYGFRLGGQRVDLAIASDRENDTLAIFSIDPATRRLTDVTASAIPETIFGVDDGEQTAYGLTAYTSPSSGRHYVFVSQGSGAQIAQLELVDQGDGTVTATVVRMLNLPVPTGDPEDSQAEGMVTDREFGFLYVAGETEYGILKFNAEPDGGNTFTELHSIDNDFLKPDVEGLAIYYGGNGAGYLLVSSQGNSTYAVFRRDGDNEYIGSFAIGDVLDIDQANESDGLDVINVPLGDRFPFGLLVVQDGANDPQFVAQDDEELENQSTNFKFVSWAAVAAAAGLMINTTSYHPRQP